MTTPLSTTAEADLLAPFGRGRASLQDSFWYSGWLLTFLATGDQTKGRFALIEALTRRAIARLATSIATRTRASTSWRARSLR
jgi:hypothetical protein